jgi:hypothetical protein
MPKKTSAILLSGILSLGLLAGCGGSGHATSTSSASSGYASEYPSQYKETYFQANHCGSAEGDSTSSCECQVKYIEAHLPYKALEEGSPEHAKAEEVLNEAPSHCSSGEHTPSEEAAHNKAVEGQEQYDKAYSEQEQKDKPEEEHLREIESKVRYERGE